MGFLDRLRGGGDITLGVSFEPPEVAPGGEVVLRFDVAGELDDKCRGVRVGVTGTGKYLVEERDRDSNNNVRTREVWREVELHEEEHAYPAQIGPGQATLTLPPSAPPSSADAVEWQAFARVDREKGLDKVEHVPLPVRQSTDKLPTERVPATTDDGLTLEDVPVAARTGDQLTGTLTVNLPDDAKVTAVRIRLHRRCTYVADRIDDYDMFRGNTLGMFVFGGGRSHITRDEKVAEVDLAGKREFAPGQVERMPFTIAVPGGLGGTTGHPYAQVDWRVEAVLDRRMRGDLSVETPLVVY
ncbi:MAG: hypothetical protein QOI80_1873 [Solirubrobacteraceae bacterium]|jgi:hypothetical protein|nr:hypothetical protein [Solirubrobacteraceae bacterium]